jgi:virginiamycin B lyase
VISLILFLPSFVQIATSQLSSLSDLANVNQEFVTYHKQSNFIHEFRVPLVNQSGLKGITTDLQGNPWLYHQTNKTSMIIRFDVANNTFSSYPVEGKTMTDNAIINLAGGQIIFDEKRNTIWFTDARLNALGSFNIKNSTIALYRVPTNNSGIMGIVMSPDTGTIWFTEIIGNKIGSFDIESKTMSEFPTGDTSGPTLLTFDDKGVLWVTLSYSNSILKVEPWLLIPDSRAGGISEIKLDKSGTFSPFGIAIAQNMDNKRSMFLSDHGSSRVIVSNLTSELRNYTTYWTSPSQSYPASLPSQVVSDKSGNIYFPEHGGNKISKISAATGLMTELDIPTGPLATAVFITVSQDGSRVWFTEWASNTIGYLDNALAVPLELKVQGKNAPLIMRKNETRPLEFEVNRVNNTTSLISLDQVEISLVGMTDSGLQGLTYLANPQRVNMGETSRINGSVEFKVDSKEAVADEYTVMVRISALEKDNLTVSILEPQSVTLDVPTLGPQIQGQNLPILQSDESSNTLLVLLKDIARFAAIGVAIALIAYLVYRKISRSKKKP